ncbi:beta-L-arabinofuranosidase domain-containing protein [Microbacterium foliorum]|uniref:beta-L-arabinofuranosidase domain-containing protein n=1 Tax=Microbacterium foliorum TaxID=104336 RepID=UPI00209FDED9|nr:beta-L-arabinofuranosidase domain-containing protein [Microbacterium foliorum]
MDAAPVGVAMIRGNAMAWGAATDRVEGRADRAGAATGSSGILSSARLRPFPLDCVRLGDDSVFARARDQMLHLARVYPVDRLLAVFRANAGLDTRGALAPGNWEDFGHPREQAWGEHDYPGRESAQTANLLRGHYAGHFLSMLSLAYAGERDETLRAKVDEFVAGLGEVQRALAATGRFSHPGFLAAYGEWQFSRLEDYAPYGEIWAPYYTTHKIMAGLLDAYELTGSTEARDIAVSMGHWVAYRLTRLDHDRIQRMWSLYIAGEYGGMNETMARLSVVADEPLFLEVARLFDQDDLLEAGADRRDVLTDMHANQHLPQLLGYLHEYDLTGERRYLDAVLGLWDQIVPGRTFAHGGTGESELWGAPDTVAGDIGHRNAETCATYNLLKIARQLFALTRDARFLAYYERGMLNHILASRRDVDSDTSPEVAYMFPVNPGAVAEFDNIGTCCGGTGLENHVKYQDTVFFTAAETDAGADDELWVALFVSAALDWREQHVTVRMLTTQPFGGTTELRIVGDDEFVDGTPLTLRIRVPEWAIGIPTLRVGDEKISAPVEDGHLVVRRRWTSGDVLRVETRASLRAVPTPDDAVLQSIEFGPSVLVARSDATTTLDLPLTQRRRLDGSLRADDAESAADVEAALRADGAVRIAGVRFEPVWTGSDDRYHMYVRASGADIAFVGAATDVPVRLRQDGSSLLDDVWREPAPQTRAAFLDRVGETASAARRDGLLAQTELIRVLEAAAAADVDGLGGHPRGAVRDTDAAGVTWLESADADGIPVVEWSIPRALAEASLAPSLAIATEIIPAPSGWFTEVPTVTVVADDLAGSGGLQVEVSLADGAWSPYTGPFPLPGDGEHQVRARATDAAGATGHAARDFAVDTGAPVSRATVRRLGSSVEITLTATDDVSGVERIQWEGPGTFWATFQEAFTRALSDEEQVVEFAATDRAGNEEARQRLILPSRDDGS